MGNFTRRVKAEFNFDDDTVTMDCERLKKEDFLLISPFIKTEKGETKFSMEDAMQFLSIADQIIPKRIKNFKGVIIEGNEASIDQIINEAYFIPLFADILNKLINISTVEEKKVKKLKPVSVG